MNYLDMNIWNEGGRWHSRLYDKRVGLVKKGLKLNKFPHPTSKLSVRCKLGIITSQLHRFEVACTKTKDFMKAAVRLYTEFIKKGYSSKMVNSYCKSLYFAAGLVVHCTLTQFHVGTDGCTPNTGRRSIGNGLLTRILLRFNNSCLALTQYSNSRLSQRIPVASHHHSRVTRQDLQHSSFHIPCPHRSCRTRCLA